MKTYCKLFLMLASITYLTSTYADVVTVNGMDNQSIDRSSIQAKIDSAQSSRTIILKGTFQLDGVTIDINKSNITLIGAGKESNWSTVLVGLLTSTGTPRPDSGAPLFQNFNRGIKVSSDASNVTIKGIKFLNLNRAITIAPQLNTNSSLCSAYQIGSGGSNFEVSDNWFENNALPVTTAGAAKNISYLNNLITNSGSASRNLYLAGLGSVACVTQNASGNFVNTVLLGIGIPKNATVSGNIIESDKASFSMVFSNVSNVKILNNSITAGPNAIGLITMRTDNGIVRDNTLDMAGVAFFGIAEDQAAPPVVFDNPKNLVSFNSVSNSIADVGVGIAIDNDISNVLALGNTFNNIGGPDYLICDANANTNDVATAICDGLGIAPSNNMIIVNNPSITVMDLGLNNKIIQK